MDLRRCSYYEGFVVIPIIGAAYYVPLVLEFYCFVTCPSYFV